MLTLKKIWNKEFFSADVTFEPFFELAALYSKKFSQREPGEGTAMWPVFWLVYIFFWLYIVAASGAGLLAIVYLFVILLVGYTVAWVLGGGIVIYYLSRPIWNLIMPAYLHSNTDKRNAAIVPALNQKVLRNIAFNDSSDANRTKALKLIEDDAVVKLYFRYNHSRHKVGLEDERLKKLKEKVIFEDGDKYQYTTLKGALKEEKQKAKKKTAISKKLKEILFVFIPIVMLIAEFVFFAAMGGISTLLAMMLVGLVLGVGFGPNIGALYVAIFDEGYEHESVGFLMAFLFAVAAGLLFCIFVALSKR